MSACFPRLVLSNHRGHHRYTFYEDVRIRYFYRLSVGGFEAAKHINVPFLLQKCKLSLSLYGFPLRSQRPYLMPGQQMRNAVSLICIFGLGAEVNRGGGTGMGKVEHSSEQLYNFEAARDYINR